jgi:DNA polymerase-1
VTRQQRALAKAINFGLMYGMGDYGLSARTDLSVEQARAFIAAYFSRFSRVKEYLEETKRLAAEKGYVETILGRRRYFPELQNLGGNSRVRRAAERAAVNMPIQGSAADIIKLAMINLHHRLQEESLAAHLVLQVHDELVVEVSESDLSRTRDLVVDTMENAHALSVPLKVDVNTGKNWMEIK